MMLIDNEFDLGQVVYVAVDPLQKAFMVVELRVLSRGGIIYLCSDGSGSTFGFYGVELSAAKSFVAG